MTLWGLLSLAAGGAWVFWGFLIGRESGTLGILIGLLGGAFIGAGIFLGTLRAGDWLISRLDELDHARTPLRRALSWLFEKLYLLGAIAWMVISNLLAVTIMTGLFTLYLPAASRAPWEVALSNGVVYLTRHPAPMVFFGLIDFAVVVLLSYLIFDRLLRIQFSEAHSDWERQGCMSGYFWSPPGCRETSRRERGDLLGKWLFNPPYWLKSSASFWRVLGLATMVVLFPPALISLLWGLPALLFAYLSPLLTLFLGAVIVIFCIYRNFKDRRERGL